jgi:hypothetical protein
MFNFYSEEAKVSASEDDDMQALAHDRGRALRNACQHARAHLLCKVLH